MLPTHSYTDFTRYSLQSPGQSPAAYVERNDRKMGCVAMYGLMLRFFGLIG
jgi:hypothetical protein